MDPDQACIRASIVSVSINPGMSSPGPVDVWGGVRSKLPTSLLAPRLRARVGVNAVNARAARALAASSDLAGDGLDRLGGKVVVAEVAPLAASALTFGQVWAWVISAWVTAGSECGVMGHSNLRVVLAHFLCLCLCSRLLALFCCEPAFRIAEALVLFHQLLVVELAPNCARASAIARTRGLREGQGT